MKCNVHTRLNFRNHGSNMFPTGLQVVKIQWDSMRYTRPFDCFVFQNLDGKTKCALFHLSGQHSTFLYNQLFLQNPKDEQVSLEAEWYIKAINSHSSYGRRVPLPNTQNTFYLSSCRTNHIRLSSPAIMYGAPLTCLQMANGFSERFTKKH